MRTVWIRTEESVKRAAGIDLDHIHHETEDLAAWLADWVAERSRQK
jgi:putative hydrolase of the HAD superfamily